MTSTLQVRIFDPPKPTVHILDAPMPPRHVFNDAEIPPFPIPTTFKDAEFTSVVTLTAAVNWVASSPATFTSSVFTQLLARVAHDWVIAPDVALSVSAAQSENVSLTPSIVLSADAGPGHDLVASADVVLSATSKATALVDAPFTTSAALSAEVVQLGGTTAAPAEFGASVAFTAEVVPAANVDAQFGAGVTLSATVKATVSAPFTISGSLTALTVVPVSALFNGSGSLSVLAEIPTTYPATNIYPSEALFPSAQLRWARSANFTAGVGLAMTAYESVSRTAAFTGGGALAVSVFSGNQFSDNFNRSDGTLTTPWLRRVSWTYSDFGITSNQLYRTDGGANDSADGSDAYIWSSPTATTNQFAQLTINTISGFPSAGVVLGTNAGGTTAGLWAEVSTSGWRIFSAVPASGSKTILASGSGTYTAGGVVRLEKSGNVATLRYKGSVLGTYTGTLPSGLYVGVRAGQGSCRSDDWSGGDL